MEDFVNFYSTNEWGQIWPELALALAAIALLGIDLFGKTDHSSGRIGLLAIVFRRVTRRPFARLPLLAPYPKLEFLFRHAQSAAGGRHEELFPARILARVHSRTSIPSCETLCPTNSFHHLTMLATAGLMLLCQSNHFLMLFVALETVAICF